MDYRERNYSYAEMSVISMLFGLRCAKLIHNGIFKCPDFDQLFPEIWQEMIDKYDFYEAAKEDRGEEKLSRAPGYSEGWEG